MPIREKPQTSFVYFLSCDRLIKVGRAVDVAKRIGALRVGHPTGVFQLLATIPGGKAEEKAIHTFLASHRVSGEWFSDCDVVRRTIQAIVSGGLHSIGVSVAATPIMHPIEEDAMKALAIIMSLQGVIGADSLDDLSEKIGLERTKLWSFQYRKRAHGFTMGEVADLLSAAPRAVGFAEEAIARLKIKAFELSGSLTQLASRSSASDENAEFLDCEIALLRAAAALDGSRSEDLSEAPVDGGDA